MTQEEYRDMAQVWNDGFRYNNTHLELNVQEIHKVVSLASISEKIMKQKKKKKIGSTFQKYDRKGENSWCAFIMIFLY